LGREAVNTKLREKATFPSDGRIVQHAVFGRICLWRGNIARRKTALAERHPDDDKHNDRPETSAAKLLSTVTGNERPEKDIHDAVLFPALIKLYACCEFSGISRMSSPSSPLMVSPFSTSSPARSYSVDNSTVPLNLKDSG